VGETSTMARLGGASTVNPLRVPEQLDSRQLLATGPAQLIEVDECPLCRRGEMLVSHGRITPLPAALPRRGNQTVLSASAIITPWSSRGASCLYRWLNGSSAPRPPRASSGQFTRCWRASRSPSAAQTKKKQGGDLDRLSRGVVGALLDVRARDAIVPLNPVRIATGGPDRWSPLRRGIRSSALPSCDLV